MQPIASGLTYLEGDRITFGAYLPILLSMHIELKKLEQCNDIKYASPLVDAIAAGFNKRFGHLLDPYNLKSIPLHLAMLTNPKFKMHYIPDGSLNENKLVKMKQILINAAEKMKIHLDAKMKMNDQHEQVNWAANDNGIIFSNVVFIT